jgi:hypothetical protein
MHQHAHMHTHARAHACKHEHTHTTHTHTHTHVYMHGTHLYCILELQHAHMHTHTFTCMVHTSNVSLSCNGLRTLILQQDTETASFTAAVVVRGEYLRIHTRACGGALSNALSLYCFCCSCTGSRGFTSYALCVHCVICRNDRSVCEQLLSRMRCRHYMHLSITHCIAYFAPKHVHVCTASFTPMTCTYAPHDSHTHTHTHTRTQPGQLDLHLSAATRLHIQCLQIPHACTYSA